MILPHLEGRWPISPNLSVRFRTRFGSTKLVPSPRYPDGSDLDLSEDLAQTCSAKLQPMLRKLGVYEVRCSTCGLSVAIISAGTTDDPRAIRVPCRWGNHDRESTSLGVG